MQVQVKSVQGKALRKVDLPDSVFGVELNENLLHAVCVGYRANRRQGTHATKTRAFVSGGGKKPFKQKGTGNARQGTSRSPNMPGGATSHGPQPRSYRKKLTRNMRQQALRVALSDKVRHEKLVVVDDFALGEYSTKKIQAALAALNTPKALISDERKDDFLYKSSRNIHGASVTAPAEMNAEDVLRYENLVLSETALNVLTQRLEREAK